MSGTQVEAQKQTANAEDLKRALADNLGPRIIDMRQRRRTVDQEDLNVYAMWGAKHTRQQYKSDTFNYYIPIGRRAIERNVTRATQMLYPATDYFEVYPGDEISLKAGAQAESVRAYMTYVTSQRMKMRRTITQLVRCLYLYKRAILKNTVSVIDVPKVQYGGFSGGLKQIWPACRAVDPFSFYVWPETATDPEDAELFCEDVMMPWSVYKANVARGVCDAIDKDDLTAPEWPYHLTERLAYAGITDPTRGSDGSGSTSPLVDARGNPMASEKKRPDEGFVAVTEIWFKMESRWQQGWLAWNVRNGPRMTRLNRSQYPDPPYRMGIARPIPNQHYTSGLGNDIEAMQVWFNDVVNQSEESRAVAAQPPTLINTTQVSRTDSFQWGIRKKWLIDGDVRTAAQMMQVADTSTTSQRQAQFIYGIVEKLAGGGLSEGQPTRNMPRNGVAVGNMISLSLADVEDIAKIVEQEILTPSLRDYHNITLAFVPPQQIIHIPGARDFPPRSMTVNDLFGAWEFKWVGSLQAQNQQMKGQQGLAFMQMLAKAQQLMEQQGWTINWGIAAKRYWRDTLGERGLEDIVIPISELAKKDPAAAAMIQMRQQAQLLAQMQSAQPQPGAAPAGGSAVPPSSDGAIQAAQSQQANGTPVGAMTAGLAS